MSATDNRRRLFPICGSQRFFNRDSPLRHSLISARSPSMSIHCLTARSKCFTDTGRAGDGPVERCWRPRGRWRCSRCRHARLGPTSRGLWRIILIAKRSTSRIVSGAMTPGRFSPQSSSMSRGRRGLFLPASTERLGPIPHSPRRIDPARRGAAGLITTAPKDRSRGRGLPEKPVSV